MASGLAGINIMRSRIFPNLLVSLMLILSSAGISVAQEMDPEFGKVRLEMNRRARAYTKLLPAVSKVELLKVGQLTADGEIGSIEASKLIEGQQARRLASVWRAQSWDYKYGGMCHEPAYVVKFYSGNKLLLHSSVCWKCGNIEFLESKIKGLQGFRSESRAAQLLLRLFNEAFSGTGR